MKIICNTLFFSLLVMIVWIMIIVIIPNLLSDGKTQSLGEPLIHGIVIPFIIAPVFLLLVIAFRGWWKETGLKPVKRLRSLLILWLPIIFIIGFFGIAFAIGLTFSQTLFFILINTMLVGISEELMFRGLVFYGAIKEFKIWTAILFTSVLFGSIHLLNGFTTGDFLGSTVQAVTAAMAGMWFIALRIRTNSIIPSIILHGLWDGGLFLMTNALKPVALDSNTETSSETSLAFKIIFPILFDLPLFLYGLWLLRRIGEKDKEDIIS